MKRTLILLFLAGPLFAGPAETDLTSYYSYPWALGPSYESATAVTPFASGFRFTDIGTEVRVPIPGAPAWQPLLRGGLVSVVHAGTVPSAWDHSLYYAMAGLGYSQRISKNLEMGGDGLVGLALSSFPDLVAGGPVGSQELVARAGLRLALLPSNSFSVELVPEASWRQTTGPLTEFDGLSYGLGLRIGWRFGDDPDAPSQGRRSLVASTTKLPAAFAAMQGFYAQNPLGTVSLKNIEGAAVTDLEASFFQAGYMDSPTPLAKVERLGPGESVPLEVRASYNQEVFRTEGKTPLVGTLTLRYRVGGKAVEQTESLSYDLNDKTAMVWDDDKKVGAFITPADSALRNYLSFVRQSLKDATLPLWNEPLQTATQTWAALTRLGLIYQSDPTSPFVRAQGDGSFVDSVNLARQTLASGTGDCDDLTVLFDSLLETTGIETGYITVPGHIFAAFNTKVPVAAYRQIHYDRSLTLPVDGTLWVPVEITLIGKQGFQEAWKKGAELWHQYDQNPAPRRFIKTQVAQAVFGPVALKETDLGLQYGNRDELSRVYRENLNQVTEMTLGAATAGAQTGDPRDLNQLALVYVRFGKLKDAETVLQKVVKTEPTQVSAQVNLGNLAFLQKDYRKALGLYQTSIKILETTGRARSPSAQQVLINLSKAYNALNDPSGAKTSFAKAESIDPEGVKEFQYLAQAGSSNSGRAASQSEGPLFLEN